MSNFHYPKINEYVSPKKNILVLSCMDLRLTDNVVNFLHFDNLTNRYDHFILAGTSLLCSKKYKDHLKAGVHKTYGHWKDAMENHIDLAIKLHGIEDIYIIEHQDCGAYANLTDSKKVKSSDLQNVKLEKEWHKKFSSDVADEINKKYKLHVHCFYIDLRGNVELLYTKQ